jgi:hypothetical protein
MARAKPKRQSEFDKMNTALDQAEFALEVLRKKAEELQRKRASASTTQEIAVLDLEAVELLEELRKISDAVHTRQPVPHLRLVSDKE